MNVLAYPMLFILVIAAILSLILSLVSKILVDQDRMKEIQKEMKAHNKKLMAATKAQDKDALAKLDKDKPRIMSMQSEMMKMQMPMFGAMLPFFVVFWALRSVSDSMEWGEFVSLPAILQGGWWGSEWTWLGWYILCSLSFSSLFRRILGVK